MDEDLIRQLAKKITAKNLKTEANLADFSKLLKKIVVETALDASGPIIWAMTRTTARAAVPVTVATAGRANALRVVIATLI